MLSVTTGQHNLGLLLFLLASKKRLFRVMTAAPTSGTDFCCHICKAYEHVKCLFRTVTYWYHNAPVLKWVRNKLVIITRKTEAGNFVASNKDDKIASKRYTLLGKRTRPPVEITLEPTVLDNALKIYYENIKHFNSISSVIVM